MSDMRNADTHNHDDFETTNNAASFSDTIASRVMENSVHISDTHGNEVSLITRSDQPAKDPIRSSPNWTNISEDSLQICDTQDDGSSKSGDRLAADFIRLCPNFIKASEDSVQTHGSQNDGSSSSSASSDQLATEYPTLMQTFKGPAQTHIAHDAVQIHNAHGDGISESSTSSNQLAKFLFHPSPTFIQTSENTDQTYNTNSNNGHENSIFNGNSVCDDVPEISLHLPPTPENNGLRDFILDSTLSPPELDIPPEIGIQTFLGPVSSLYREKPSIPYQKGWRFFAHVHTPCAPVPVKRGSFKSSFEVKAERVMMSLRDRCLRHPPISGSSDCYALELQIQSQLQVGDGHRAQVVTVSLCGLSDQSGIHRPKENSDRKFVAKIFDPLYIDDDTGYLDPFYCVDNNYTHECQAFQTLREFQHQNIPEFFGSYSICLALAHHPDSYRIVRMVLMEYIEGISMSQLQPSQIPQQIRKQILHTIVDFESKVYQKDICLMDVSPRNIMLVDFDNTEMLPKIVFVDLADSIFQRFLEDDDIPHEMKFLGLYMSPLIRWPQIPGAFEDWVDWDWDSWLYDTFGHTETTITPEMREYWLEDLSP